MDHPVKAVTTHVQHAPPTQTHALLVLLTLSLMVLGVFCPALMELLITEPRVNLVQLGVQCAIILDVHHVALIVIHVPLTPTVLPVQPHFPSQMDIAAQIQMNFTIQDQELVNFGANKIVQSALALQIAQLVLMHQVHNQDSVVLVDSTLMDQIVQRVLSLIALLATQFLTVQLVWVPILFQMEAVVCLENTGMELLADHVE